MATGYNVRVGDADREAVTAQLREHYADGRLTLEELNERLDQAFVAKTKADLNTVMRDLPQATRPGADMPSGGTAWQGPAWHGPMATRPGQDYGHGSGHGQQPLPAGAAARLCGLDAAGSATTVRGALVHDVGRVAVPVRIWNKAGPLTPEKLEQLWSDLVGETFKGEIRHGFGPGPGDRPPPPSPAADGARTRACRRSASHPAG